MDKTDERQADEAEMRRAARTAYWTRYHRLQELWRTGEVLSVERWGRKDVPGEGDEQEMKQLCQGLEALLVGFE